MERSEDGKIYSLIIWRENGDMGTCMGRMYLLMIIYSVLDLSSFSHSSLEI